MANDTAITVRIPAALKRGMEARARVARRSLSAQVLHDLEAAAALQPAAVGAGAKFLGLFTGSPVPGDADIADVRRRLWGRLHARRDV